MPATSRPGESRLPVAADSLVALAATISHSVGFDSESLSRYIVGGLMLAGTTSSSPGRAAAAGGGDPPECFDATLAAGPTRIVPVSGIVDLLSITHAPDRIEDYRVAMLRGSLFPPIAVVRLFGRLIVADGHKRLAACAALGASRIPVEVWGLRRFLRDQARQVAKNARKNGTILRTLLRDPREAARLLATTLRHWRRVAVCLASRVRSSRAG